MQTVKINLLNKLVELFSSINSAQMLQEFKDKIVSELMSENIGCSLDVAEDWALRALERTSWKNVDLEWS